MYREMLGTGSGLQKLSLSLNTLYVVHSESSGQIRILTVGLLSSAPSWVAEYVDVRCPICKVFEYVEVLEFVVGVVFCSRLS